LWSSGFTPYSLDGIYQHFEGTYCLLVQVHLGGDAVGICRQVAKITHSHRSGREAGPNAVSTKITFLLKVKLDCTKDILATHFIFNDT
jgi:hypothetical protein